MADLQRRLSELGLTGSDPEGEFADATAALVEAFQRSRGLALTGIVDATTWSRLVEAGWRLGDRLLYLSAPALRGDDVAELQTRLAQLGFNPGRIDGILGSQTEGALADFQRNCGLTGSGVLDRASWIELVRLSALATDRHPVTEARAQAGLDEDETGPVVVVGAGELAEAVARRAASSFEVRRLDDPSPEACAAAANDWSAALVLSFETAPERRGVSLHYWASYRSHSPRGERLAAEIARCLARLGERCEVTGMALPILRETRMTTLHVEHGLLQADQADQLAESIAGAAAELFHR